jgi:hypothetical protein
MLRAGAGTGAAQKSTGSTTLISIFIKVRQQHADFYL